MQNRPRKNFISGLVVVGLLLANFGQAYVASSPSYRIQSDSINFAGDDISSSSNYNLVDTMGEIGTGEISASDVGQIGYRAMQETYLSVSAPDNVTLTPSINGRRGKGGTATGNVSWTVITDNPAGYTMSVLSASSPALQSSSDSFADYNHSVEYNWFVALTESRFGFTANGSDVSSVFKSNGSACGSGTADGSHCWRGFSLASTNIASGGPNHGAGGVATTLSLKAEVGLSKLQNYGTYTADLSVTVLAL